MRYVTGVGSGQMEIRVGCVEDEIEAENPVWFIEAFVDAAKQLAQKERLLILPVPETKSYI